MCCAALLKNWPTILFLCLMTCELCIKLIHRASRARGAVPVLTAFALVARLNATVTDHWGFRKYVADCHRGCNPITVVNKEEKTANIGAFLLLFQRGAFLIPVLRSLGTFYLQVLPFSETRQTIIMDLSGPNSVFHIENKYSLAFLLLWPGPIYGNLEWWNFNWLFLAHCLGLFGKPVRAPCSFTILLRQYPSLTQLAVKKRVVRVKGQNTISQFQVSWGQNI